MPQQMCFILHFFSANDFLFGGFFFIPHPLDNHEQQQNYKEALVVCSFELKKRKKLYITNNKTNKKTDN